MNGTNDMTYSTPTFKVNQSVNLVIGRLTFKRIIKEIKNDCVYLEGSKIAYCIETGMGFDTRVDKEIFSI